MSDNTEYLIQGSTLTGIADAIRAKTGKTDAIPVPDMAAEIRALTVGTILEALPISLDFSAGDMQIEAPDGSFVKSAIIQQPDTLIPENIAAGVEVAGILGTHQGGGGSSADVRYVTFMSYDGTVEYGKKAVAVGDDCADPIARGVFDTPTRESTAQYNYTFYGWATTANGAADSNALKAVTEDRTVYANFAAVVRCYTITYYDDDGTTVLNTEPVAYGSVPSYTPTKDGYMHIGWTPTPVAVTGEASYVANWTDDVGFATAPFSVLKSVLASGQASTVWAVEDTRSVPMTLNDGTVINVDYEIRHFDENGKPYIVTKNVFKFTMWCASGCSSSHYLNGDSNQKWGDCHVFDMYQSDIFNALPTELQEIVADYSHNTIHAQGGGSQVLTNVTVNGKAWIPSNSEMNSWYSSNTDRIKYEQTANGVGTTAIQYCTRDMRASIYWRPSVVNTGGSVQSGGDTTPYSCQYAPIALMLSVE